MLCRLVPLLVLCACTSGPAYLTGSIGETLPLGFDRARIRLQDAWLVVDYLRDHPSGTETVCKLVLDTDGLPSGTPLALAGEELVGRVGLQRSTFDDHGFPELTEGSLLFDPFELFEGGEVAGEFVLGFDGDRHLLGGVADRLSLVAEPTEP